MHVLSNLGIILAGYLALGRTGAIAAALMLKIGFGMTLLLALLFDLVQIPVYGILLETSTRKVAFGRKVAAWMDRRRQKWQEKMNSSKFWTRLVHFKPLAVIAVSTIPMRGCGIISACILSFMLGYGRVQGTILIMTGSVLGALITLAVLFGPLRMLYAY